MTYDTSSHPDLSASSTGAVGRTRPGGPTLYVLADQMVWRTGPNGTDGVIPPAGYTHADPRVSVIEQLVFGGVLARGIFPGRPQDTIGFQTTWFKASKQLTATQELQSALGQPLMSGLGGVTAPPGIQGHETNLEAVYDIHAATGLHVEPCIQYIIRPDAVRHYPNATVLALQVTVDF
jgi:porin